MTSSIRDHYTPGNLIQKIFAALEKAGKDPVRLTHRDLAPLDQLHTGGDRATLALMEHVRILPAHHILDAGCGLGGSVRLLAREFGCRATGIDLSEEFIDAARELTALTGTDGRIGFHAGSILDLPFEDNYFDAVFCQHILMNIEDKPRALAEFHRTLKPGGMLILHEITGGENPDLSLPVPWAATPDMSFLIPWEELDACLSRAGFRTDFYRDGTDGALTYWEKVAAVSAKKTHSPPPLNPGLVFGGNARFFKTNMPLNFKKDAVRLFEAVMVKA